MGVRPSALLTRVARDDDGGVGRPASREQLLEAARTGFARLEDVVTAVAPEQREEPGACEAWSVKDLLAHLDAWHTMFLGWEAAGSAGEQVDMPATGYRWSDTPALNQAIHDRTADDAWGDVMARLRDSHRRVLDVIRAYSDDDLFTKKRYAWTGSTSVGSYAVSTTSSHYEWATKLIRKWAKAST